MAPPGKSTRPIGLSSLRGFEAAARLLSFTAAADELSLTQSSISRQIRTLEGQVGRALFKRRIRSLELTPAGEHLYRAVHASLGDLDRAVDDIRRGPRRSRVTLTTFASFASLALVPRLAQFSARHPEIDIEIDASDEARDLEADGIDLAIRYQRRERAPAGAVLLQIDEMVPVVSPALLARLGPIERPDDFAKTTMLVHDDGTRYSLSRSWAAWYRGVGLTMPLEAATIRFNFMHQAIEAALRGQGSTLAPLIFVREHLARGELVAPIARITEAPFAYFLIVNPASAERAPVLALADWLVAELQLDQAGGLRVGAARASGD